MTSPRPPRRSDPEFPWRASLITGALTTVLLALQGCGGCRAIEDPSGATGASSSGTSSPLDESGSDGSGSQSTGPVDPQALVPCDPNASACESGVCSGRPWSGYFCRPSCPSGSDPMDPCERGVCLPTTPDAASTACFRTLDCDPTTGAGCLDPRTSCALLDTPDVTGCLPVGDATLGEACDPTAGLSCERGTGCLGSDLEGDDPGRCTAWCDPDVAGDESCPVCVPFGTRWGSCAGCDVMDDRCEEGTQCQPINEALGGSCVAFGPGAPGDTCHPRIAEDSCQDGLLCLETEQDDTFACLAGCDPSAPVCDPELRCIDLGLLLPSPPVRHRGVCTDAFDIVPCVPQSPTACTSEEVCIETGTDVGVCTPACDPTEGAAACEDNAVCLPFTDGTIPAAPFAAGNGFCGAGCQDDTQCGAGVCLAVLGGETLGLCGEACVPGEGTCDSGQACVPRGDDPDQGVCIDDGRPCTVASDCNAGPAPAMCIPVGPDGTSSACIPGCYAQDPGACAGSPEACHPRLDADFREGVCVGQADPCDPIGQDCDAAQACQPLGGGALGGWALICEAAGPAEDDQVCDPQSGPRCAAGLGCVEGRCRRWCDPSDPQCPGTSCEDLSALFYVPTGTIGACPAES